jgi:hypothetical protein
LGVPDATQTRLLALVLQAASEPEQAKAVFTAALPLVQGKPATVAAVEALLLAVLRLDPENKELGDSELRKQAIAVISEAVQPLVQAKLSALGMPEATQTRLAALVLQAASEPEQAKAVFTATLPLAQGKPTVAAVEALLLAVLRLDPENKVLGDGELKKQAMAVISEAVQPLVQAKLSALCMPEATQTRLAALVLQAASEPEQAKAVFTAALPLAHGTPATVAAVEALLLAVLRLDPENKELGDSELNGQAIAVISEAVQPLVQVKLSALDVPEATQTRLLALVLQAASEPEQANALFDAVLPLVQGEPTVAAVEALLLAVLRLDPENKELGDGELRKQAMAVISEAVQPLVQAKSKMHPWKVKRASMTTQTAAASAISHRLSVTLEHEAAAASAPALSRSTGKNQSAQPSLFNFFVMLLYLPLDEATKWRAMADPLNQITRAAGGANTLVSTYSSHDAQNAGMKRVKTIFRVKGGVARKLSLDAKAPRANHLLHSEVDMKRTSSLPSKGSQNRISANANARKSSETAGTGTQTGTSMNGTPWKAKRASLRTGISAAHANVHEAAGTGKSEQDYCLQHVYI